MQTDSSKIRTRVTVYISNDDNHNITHTHTHTHIYMCVCDTDKISNYDPEKFITLSFICCAQSSDGKVRVLAN